LLSSSEHSGVPEDSQPPTFPSVGLHPHTWPKWGCDMTEQHVAGQGLHTCTVSVNMKILIWIMWPRILISGGGFSLEESEREMRSAWDAW